MNKTIITYTFSNIFSQPLTKLLIFFELLVIIFFIVLKIEIAENEIIALSCFGIILDEPFVIKSFAKNFTILYTLFFNFIVILIAARLFNEGYKDPFLDIIIPKLKNIREYYYSQLLGFLLWFSFNLLIFLPTIAFLFSIHSGLIYFEPFAIILFLGFINIFYISVVLSLLSMLFDGFTASLLLLLPLLFGSTVIALLNSSEEIIYLINIVFPFIQTNILISSIFKSEFVINYTLLFSLPLLLVVVKYSEILFKRKWL